MIDLKKASKDEIRQYARDELGLTFPPAAGVDTMRSAVAQALGLDAEDKPKEAKVVPEADGRIAIVIHKTGEQGGDRAVPVGVNGRMYLIKRGEEVRVPAAVVEVLKNAVETKYEWRPDPTKPNGGEMVARDAQAYPFSVLGH